jgi:hypothetical protein
MDILKTIILLVYLVIIMMILSFNWLYSARTIRANRHIGLYTPSYIRRIVKVSNGIALFTALLIGIVLITGRF